MSVDPREVLGVDRYASIEECRKAYRALARKNHPDVDKTPGSRERMVKINAAWELVQRLPQPKPPVVRAPADTVTHYPPGSTGDPFRRGPVPRATNSNSRPYATMSMDELWRIFGAGMAAQRTSNDGYASSSNSPQAEAVRRAAEAFGRGASWSGFPLEDDGSIKVPAADFTGDACEYRMPAGLFEGQRLGDIIRDHEWYGDEIDQYPVGDPIRKLFATARKHWMLELKGRPFHDW